MKSDAMGANPTMIQVASAVEFSVSFFVFFTLVVGDYLVGSPSSLAQGAGSFFLTPVFFFSVAVLGLNPFNEGLWAFASFCIMTLSIVGLRTRGISGKRALIDAVTLFAPAVLVCFETGVLIFIPQYFYSQVTNFVGSWGLGLVLTNFTVLLISSALLCIRLGLRVVMRSLWTGNV